MASHALFNSRSSRWPHLSCVSLHSILHYRLHRRGHQSLFLHHLYHHQNTATFVAYRLLQRLIASNPSPRFVKTVVQAFTTGTHDGVTYSGQYGDLAATTAAMVSATDQTLTLSHPLTSHSGLLPNMVQVLDREEGADHLQVH